MIAVLVFVCSAFPVYWMINSSFLPTNLIRNTELTFFPGSSFTWKNYEDAIFNQERSPFLPALGNSVLVTFFVLVVSMILAFLASLALTRFKFKGRKAFIIAILAVQMIPGEAMMISIFRIVDGWQLLNSVIGLGIVYLSGVLPFTIWTLRGFVAGVPAELEEAAMIDGCSRSKAFWRITFRCWPRPRGDRCLRVHPGLERVRDGVDHHDPSGVHDPSVVAADLPAGDAGDQLGRSDGRLGPHRDPRRRLLPHRAGAHDRRPGLGCGEGLT
ncbi:carbohydrate ABC transporter permease [Oerskovia sp. M15]